MKKRVFRLDKLVRGKLYHKMMEDQTVDSQIKTLSAAELLSYFKKKMVEEADEVVEAESTDDLIDELADCLEVIRGFSSCLNVNFDTVERARVAKKEARGDFSEGIVIDTVSMPEDHQFAQYCLANPAKYPEVKSS